MANPAKLTVTKLALDGSVAQPVADTIDTAGTVPIVPADYGGDMGNLMIEVVEQNVDALTVTVLAGDNPPAVRSGLGNLVVAVAKNTGKVIGPLESARFIQDDGKLNVAFAATTTVSAKVRTYLLPKV